MKKFIFILFLLFFVLMVIPAEQNSGQEEKIVTFKLFYGYNLFPYFQEKFDSYKAGMTGDEIAKADNLIKFGGTSYALQLNYQFNSFMGIGIEYSSLPLLNVLIFLSANMFPITANFIVYIPWENRHNLYFQIGGGWAKYTVGIFGYGLDIAESWHTSAGIGYEAYLNKNFALDFSAVGYLPMTFTLKIPGSTTSTDISNQAAAEFFKNEQSGQVGYVKLAQVNLRIGVVFKF